jgi:hypothetical protein
LILIKFNNVHKEGVTINFTIIIGSPERDKDITHPSGAWFYPKSLILINEYTDFRTLTIYNFTILIDYVAMDIEVYRVSSIV